MGADGCSTASRIVGQKEIKHAEIPDNTSDRDLEAKWVKEGKFVKFEGTSGEMHYVVMCAFGSPHTDVEKTETEKAITGALNEVGQVFSPFIPTSEVNTLNRTLSETLRSEASGRTLPISEHMASVLKAAIEIFKVTRGSFDPTYALLRDLHSLDAQPKGSLFSCMSLEQKPATAGGALQDYLKLDLTGDEGKGVAHLLSSLLKQHHEIEFLNLCGIAKGFAIDLIGERLQKRGIENAFISWGGDVKALGRHPTGRKWRTRVQFLEGDGVVLRVVELRPGEAVATSGDYLNAVELRGIKSSHIFNAAQSKPLPVGEKNIALCAVTVCNSCMHADALATSVLAASGDTESNTLKLLKNLQMVPRKFQVRDYIYLVRDGNKVVQCLHPGSEERDHHAERQSQHDPATVVVVGGGLAGLTAAVHAARANAKVIVLEKEARTGGNSAKATSGINAWGSDVQSTVYTVPDDERYFERDTFKSAIGGRSNHGLVRLLSTQSQHAIDFLKTDIGVPLTVLSQLGGHSRKRSHRAPPKKDGTPTPIGHTIMQAMRDHIEATFPRNVEIRTNTEVVSLLGDDTEVKGVRLAGGEELMADSVVLTTGGFGYGEVAGSLLKEVRPDLAGVPTTCGEWTTGSGIRIGAALGANLIDMDKVQLHPTSFIDPKDPSKNTKFLGPEALRGSGGILLNQKGERFVNELDLRSVVSEAIQKGCANYPETSLPFAYCVLNRQMQHAFGLPLLNFYKDKIGLFKPAGSAAEVASIIGCPEAAVTATFAAYSKAVSEKLCPLTGKIVFPADIAPEDAKEGDSTSAYVVAAITPAVHYCMGGLEISSAGEVQKPVKSAFGKRKPIKRLFAAGECTGGVHGANRLGGNSLLECVVMGTVCGDRAATIKQREATCLHPESWTPLVLRERKVTDAKFGRNTCSYRFNLHGALQSTGLRLGEFIAVRGELDGDTLQGFYSPITRPTDYGCIEILSREDNRGGPIVEVLKSLRPGSSLLFKSMGGLKIDIDQKTGVWTCDGRQIKKVNLLAGGTGIAPMIQIIRTFLKTVDVEKTSPAETGLRLLYAAEEESDLAFAESTEVASHVAEGFFKRFVCLNRPPPGWSQGVGIIEPDDIVANAFPAKDGETLLTVICGPPIFEHFMVQHLKNLGHAPNTVFSYSQAAKMK
eukprot:TRINITY_DN16771_c0_g1_i1.p1 TRINITY_DN16771_c0_g1~~TRINITY_DN16771_c0_g1_i1.p1  ORF type:complete len:1191 (+),score=481.32 TRINITY_DN16771_c0_g1_i1:91-3573(+)